jgi:His-Xaa-Ser system protein HxsD
MTPFDSDNVATLDVDCELYLTDVVFRVAYDFTGRCFVFVTRPDATTIRVTLAPKSGDGSTLAGEFANALIDQRLRQRVEEQTHEIRDLLVAQAFVEADLLDRSEVDADYHDDPRGIAR